MARFRVRAKEALERPSLVGFSVPEGQEETSRGGGLIDTDILIRAAVFLGSGLIRYRDMEKHGKPGSAYKSVEEHWDFAIEGFEKAVSLFRGHGVPNGSWLPYRYLILPPAIAAAKGHSLTDGWVAWAILASLWRHYAGEVDTKLERDTGLANKSDIPGLLEHLKSRAKRVESAVPELEDFTENIVADGGVWLALLVHFAEFKARSFPGGKLINSADEPLEVHHIFPRAELDAFPGRDNDYVADRLGNLTIITRGDNEHLGDTPPADYLPEIPGECLAHHFIPPTSDFWGVKQYIEFCRARERLMGESLRALLARLAPA